MKIDPKLGIVLIFWTAIVAWVVAAITYAVTVGYPVHANGNAHAGFVIPLALGIIALVVGFIAALINIFKE